MRVSKQWSWQGKDQGRDRREGHGRTEKVGGGGGEIGKSFRGGESSFISVKPNTAARENYEEGRPT